MQGFLFVDKPANITSHHVVHLLRQLTGEKTIGHAGTLDPFATGLLIMGVGRAFTRRLDEWKNLPKRYEAEIMLGAQTETGDLTGHIVAEVSPRRPTQEEVEEALQKFLGAQTQIPPMYSAKKVGGKKLYELARQGKTIERAPQAITIHEIKLEAFSYPVLKFSCLVSPGTYVRTLAEDIAKSLQTTGYLQSLRRTEIGQINVKNAIPVHAFTPEVLKNALE